MDLTVSKNALQSFASWFGRSAAVTNTVVPEVRRPPYPCVKIDPLPSSSPEAQGIDSGYILKYYDRLCREPLIKMQTVIIARNGRIISRGHFYPYSTDIWHVSHSLCKSLAGLAVGLLFDDGLISLDDKLIDIMKDSLPPTARINHRNTTIRHMLTMQTGVIFNEIGTVTEEDWCRAYLESGVKFRPGTAFDYNSMNTYMLCAIVKKLSGKGVLELLKERVFTPLGIEHIYWEKCPKGIEKGGFGVYYYPDDILKVGLLYLNGGVWEGKRLISEKWIKESTKVQVKTPDETGIYGYGYQVWCKEDRSTFIFNGMFGQNLIVFPKTKIMIATTASIDETFQNSPLYTVTERFFGTPFRPKAHMNENSEALAKLRETESALVMENSDIFGFDGKFDPDFIKSFDGSYSVAPEDGIGLGVMPELFQGVHNCFAEGLHEFSIATNEEGGTITTLEGNTLHKVSFGLGKAVPGCVVYGKESILTSAYATQKEEDGEKTLKITVCFPELPNIRYLTISKTADGIAVKFEEAPGFDFMLRIINRTFLGKVPMPDGKTRATDTDFVQKRMRYFLQPTVRMKKIQKDQL